MTVRSILSCSPVDCPLQPVEPQLVLNDSWEVALEGVDGGVDVRHSLLQPLHARRDPLVLSQDLLLDSRLKQTKTNFNAVLVMSLQYTCLAPSIVIGFIFA